jgi:hypothetical protein
VYNFEGEVNNEIWHSVKERKCSQLGRLSTLNPKYFLLFVGWEEGHGGREESWEHKIELLLFIDYTLQCFQSCGSFKQFSFHDMYI